MRKRTARWFTLLAVSLTCLGGCGPAVQPLPADERTAVGTPVPVDVWDAILAGAKSGMDARTFMFKSDVTLVQGPIHSSFSVYGAVNPPDKAQLGFTSATDYIQYYQQGKSAYYNKDNGHWLQTTALPQINPYASFFDLIESARANRIPLRKLDRQYVVDEYCDVYQATIPSSSTRLQLNWIPAHLAAETGEVQYTFYVGEKDGLLRKVDTSSVSGLPDVGSMQCDSQTVIFDINQDIAKVKLPPDLVTQLESSGD
jgi:hypothetical protein